MDLKEVNVDLNTLFNLTVSYNFESLKLYLTTLNENQKEMTKTIEDLQNKLKKANEQHEAFQRAVIQNQGVTDRRIKQLEAALKYIKESKKKEEEEKPKKEEPKIEKETKIEETKPVEEPKVEEIKQDKKEETENKQENKEEDKENKEEPKIEEKDKEEETAKVEEKEKIEETQKVEEEKPKTEEEPKQEENIQNIDFNPMNININEENKNINYASGKSDVNKEKSKETDEDVDEDGYDFPEPVPNNNFFLDNSEMEDLKKRVTDLEQKMKNMNMMKFSGFGGSSNNSSEDLSLVKADLDNVKSMVNDHYKDTEEMKKVLEQIKLKVQDFNIADLFKDSKIEGGDIDASKILITNLENKLNYKISSLEDKVKKSQEDIFKIKNEQNNFKNTQDSLTRIINGLKEDLKQLADLMQSSFGSTNDQINDLDLRFKAMIDKINKTIENNEKLNKSTFDKIRERLEELEKEKQETERSIKSGNGGLTETDLKFLQEISVRMNDIEKSLKIIQMSSDIPNLKKDVSNLKEEMNRRAMQQDLYDLSDKVNDHSLKIGELQNDIDNLIRDSEKYSEGLNFTVKKLESINAQLSLMKQGGSGDSSGGKSLICDFTKFLEISAFHDFIKRYERDYEKLRKEIDEIKRYLSECTNAVKTKAEEEDFRNLEASVNAKIEEIRLGCNRKYADKADTSKSIKYLDAQLKHIIEVYIKRQDKSDNWLLAKKPISGHMCASCEAYLGELQDKKDDYIVWNKYPMREQDKGYRIGSGFSRMLNMLSLDSKADSGNASDGEGKKVNNMNGNCSLPNIKMRTKGNTEEYSSRKENETEVEGNRSSSPSG
ncbi:MAG: hypothetical protein MJ252_21610 [archaeon]|nr:hypothetical protein [archaeon]